MRLPFLRFVLALAAAAGLIAAVLGVPGKHAVAADDSGWVIRNFDATYTINSDGTVKVVEDLRVDFGNLERHGIFRDIPVRYRYDDKHDRLITVDSVTVLENSNRSEEHTSELQSRRDLVCRLLLEKKRQRD